MTTAPTPAPVTPAPTPAKPGLMSRLLTALETDATTVSADLKALWGKLSPGEQALVTMALPLIEQAIDKGATTIATVLLTNLASTTNLTPTAAITAVQGVISQVETAMTAPAAAVAKAP
jgi:hypothetical protein